MKRKEFLARLRKQLQAAPIHKTAAEEPAQPPRPKLAPAEAGDAGAFVTAWEAEGGYGYCLAAGELPSRAVEVAEERGAEKAVLCSRAYEAFAQEVFRELDEAGITVLEPEKGNRAGYERFAAQADVGVVFASAGVAVTGTAVVEGVPAQPRLPGILPPTLLVVVRRSTIFPTLEDALSQLSERNTTDNLPQNSSLLTGPSKSADIGMELVTNVHGPGDVHALVVTDR